MSAIRHPNLLPTHARVRRLLLRIAGIAGADLVSQGVRILVVAWPFAPSAGGLLLVEIARNSLPLAAGVALALDLFEDCARAWRPALRWLALGVAIAIVVATTSAVVSAETAIRLGLSESGRTLALHTVWNNLVVSLLAVAYLTRRRESSEAERRRGVQASRLEHARLRLAGVSAQAAQSRLDPQMLFDCLSRARCTYPANLDRGDALLARLTTYLRLTLSIGSSEASMLGREAALAASRFDVERRESDSPFVIDIDPLLASYPFPPDLLALLIQRWMASAPIDRPRALHLAARTDGGALCVSLRGSCPPPRDAVAQSRQEIARAAGGFLRYLDSDPEHLELEIAYAR